MYVLYNWNNVGYNDINLSIRTYLGVDLAQGHMYKEVKLSAHLYVQWRWLVVSKIFFLLKTVNFIQT